MLYCSGEKKDPGWHSFLKLSKVMARRRRVTVGSGSSGERAVEGTRVGGGLCSCLCGHKDLTAALSTRALRGHAANVEEVKHR